MQVGIVQFTTEVRVEVDPSSVELAEVPAQVDRMQRMSGGTNLEAPIHRVRSLARQASLSLQRTVWEFGWLLDWGLAYRRRKNSAGLS